MNEGDTNKSAKVNNLRKGYGHVSFSGREDSGDSTNWSSGFLTLGGKGSNAKADGSVGVSGGSLGASAVLDELDDVDVSETNNELILDSVNLSSHVEEQAPDWVMGNGLESLDLNPRASGASLDLGPLSDGLKKEAEVINAKKENKSASSMGEVSSAADRDNGPQAMDTSPKYVSPSDQLRNKGQIKEEPIKIEAFKKEQREERASSLPVTSTERNMSFSPMKARSHGQRVARRVAARPSISTSGVMDVQMADRASNGMEVGAGPSADDALHGVVQKLQTQISGMDVTARLNVRDALNTLANRAVNSQTIPTSEQVAVNKAAEYLVLRLLFLCGPQVMHTAPGTAPSCVPQSSTSGPTNGMVEASQLFSEASQVVPGIIPTIAPTLQPQRSINPQILHQQLRQLQQIQQRQQQQRQQQQRQRRHQLGQRSQHDTQEVASFPQYPQRSSPQSSNSARSAMSSQAWDQRQYDENDQTSQERSFNGSDLGG